MAMDTWSTVVLLTSLALPVFIQRSYSLEVNVSQAQALTSEADYLQFQLNLEYLEAEFLLHAAFGYGLDAIAPDLAQGGPPPFGGQLANLDTFTRDVFSQFAYQKVSHLRAIIRTVRGSQRPLLNISKEVIGEFANQVVGRTLIPAFNPYANTLNFLLTCYGLFDLAPAGYFGIIPELQNVTLRKLVAGLLGVESGQYSIIRELLYQRRNFLVQPYPITVTEYAQGISDLANRLGNEGTKSEGLVVPPSEGAEGKVSGNVIAADNDSLAFARKPQAILRIVYGSGNERVPGGIYPKGANGAIARSYLSAAK